MEIYDTWGNDKEKSQIQKHQLVSLWKAQKISWSSHLKNARWKEISRQCQKYLTCSNCQRSSQFPKIIQLIFLLEFIRESDSIENQKELCCISTKIKAGTYSYHETPTHGINSDGFIQAIFEDPWEAQSFKCLRVHGAEAKDQTKRKGI